MWVGAGGSPLNEATESSQTPLRGTSARASRFLPKIKGATNPTPSFGDLGPESALTYPVPEPRRFFPMRVGSHHWAART